MYDKFAQNCGIAGITMANWAEQNGLSNSMPTTLKKGVRPTHSTLEKLLHSWPRPEMRLHALQAYLKDEIERLGFSLDAVEPVLKSGNASPELDEDLKTVAEFMQHAPIRDSMHQLAVLLRMSEWAKNPEAFRAQTGRGTAVQKKKKSNPAAKGASKK